MIEDALDLPFNKEEPVKVITGDWAGETGFVKGLNKKKGLVLVKITSDGQTLWFHSHKLEKFNPED